jgi:hypothetical protein
VAVAVDGEPSPQEREVVENLLNEGAIPLILTMGAASPNAPWFRRWLHADRWLRLPEAPPTTHRPTRA